jgi:hypothetical protein
MLEEVGVPGLGAFPEFLEFLDETETLCRRFPYLRRLSAPPLALDADRLRPDFVVVFATGTVPPCTSFIVCSSAAVPVIPNKKLS